MSISADQFKQGMRRLGGAVNIVTTSHKGVWAGLTATAVTSLSAQPPRLLACVNRQGTTYETISRGRTLAVNVLGIEHKELAMRFAGMTNIPETDRFDEADWKIDYTGAPVLAGALVSFDCEVESIMDVGSHGIVIGNIKSVQVSARQTYAPLCYVDGKWAVLDTLES